MHVNLDDWQQLRAELMGQLRDWYGEIPPPDLGIVLDSALKTEEMWRREYFTHTEIKLSYEGEPGERLAADAALVKRPTRGAPPRDLCGPPVRSPVRHRQGTGRG